MFIEFDDDKGASPSWLYLRRPARFRRKLVAKYHYHSPNLNRLHIVSPLSRPLSRSSSRHLQSLVCRIPDFLVSVVIIVRGRNRRRVDSVGV